MNKKNLIKKYIFFLITLFLLSLPFVILAQDQKSQDEIKLLQGGIGSAEEMLKSFGGPAGFTTGKPLEVAIGELILGALTLIGVIFGLLVVYGGYLWLIARGNEKFVEKAKDTLEAAIIGLLIVMGAYAITSFILNAVIQAGGFQVGGPVVK